ncbi:thiamine pyrophosphate-dependent enzyme [Desulforhopalus singaporensis]|uniref:Pyruvate ferredoxin/flavodoxin oxidoreductase n=1 Tax=Desulforhopalus singaporensis TaxID=91360 RepID=A0A1H0RRS9_9BACT|nr:thiamine pyrophosphate-dependent enzyme [Desulforhopalus singaporensis]SDP32214.1 Pyruvate ferredoxin/flavodoxin oxidoreductase [Desulforhopalus singaporensis]
MNSFLNVNRPPVFCPGCTHEKITQGLDKALVQLGLRPDKTVIVSDIGCSGLFDTFFNVHALHGLHGRALTYAFGLKLANPELNVIVTMGDGGLGIGGAHVLASCRKNPDITLIVLNNFNFGMTGGQYSVTTPADAITGSEFLNRAEIPLDICAVAESAGATWIDRCSGQDSDLAEHIVKAVRHKGFSVVETLGLCTGRYTKRNKLTPKILDQMIADLPVRNGLVEKNARPEYGELYRKFAAEKTHFPEPVTIEKRFSLEKPEPQEVVILGSAGMRIVTAGDIVCYAGLSAGMNVSMKNDYNITVLRGQSVSEILISPEKIGYAGIKAPTVVLALSEEGVQRRKNIFKTLSPSTFVLKEKSVEIPDTGAEVHEIDFKSYKISKPDWALASLGFLADKEKLFTSEMLQFAIRSRFNEKVSASALETVAKLMGN